MHALITFYKGKRELTALPYPIEKPEDYAAAINAAYAQFKKENPKVNLFDGVHVMFDHVEVAPTVTPPPAAPNDLRD
jgi:hypothetical protein